MELFSWQLLLGVLYLRTVLGILPTNPNLLAKLFIFEEDVSRVLRSVYRVETQLPAIAGFLQGVNTRQQELRPQVISNRVGETPIAGHSQTNLAYELYWDSVLEDLVGNPIHVYTLIWRWVKLLPQIVIDYRGKFSPFLKNCLKKIGDIGEKEIDWVTQAIVRIQFAYRLDPYNLAMGDIRGFKTKGRLNAEQMLDIARRCYSGKQKIRPIVKREFASAIEWTEAAIELVEKGSGLERELVELLATVTQVHDLLWINPIGKRGLVPDEEFFHERLSTSGKTGRQLRREEDSFLARTRQATSQVETRLHYNLHDLYDLCRGEQTQLATVHTPCMLDHRNEAYFYLSPIHVEIISTKPEVYIFHDIISDTQIKLMQDVATSRLKASLVTSGVADEKEVLSNLRTQSNAWLWDDTLEEMYQLSKRLSKITGLNVHPPVSELRIESREKRLVEAEAWQVGVYTPGGHYLPHEDAFTNVYNASRGPAGEYVGNRIATAMFYLSDVKVGGSTVFPIAGISIKPKKGSAAFWYNLDTAGNGLNSSLHSACPTGLGLKWVSNKWIREGAQIFKRPCVLSEWMKIS